MSPQHREPLPDVIHVQVLKAEVLEVLRAGVLRPEAVLLLASVAFADEEGIARMSINSLRRWCGKPDGQRASKRFIQARIDDLIAAGVLAPGSTPEELRSMTARRTETTEEKSA